LEQNSLPHNSSQLGLIDGKRFEDWPKWEGQGVPLRENCDLNNPRQKFLWMFTALPGVKGAPLLMPVDYWEMVSWRQCVLGGDITGEPGLKYVPPPTMANPWTASGRWADLSEPDEARATLAEVMDQHLTAADKAEIRGFVEEKLGLRQDMPDIIGGHQYRLADLSKRLEVPVEEMIRILGDFGLNVTERSLVDRSVADRIVTHLGL
jgi:hypothetical protein